MIVPILLTWRPSFLGQSYEYVSFYSEVLRVLCICKNIWVLKLEPRIYCTHWTLGNCVIFLSLIFFFSSVRLNSSHFSEQFYGLDFNFRKPIFFSQASLPLTRNEFSYLIQNRFLVLLLDFPRDPSICKEWLCSVTVTEHMPSLLPPPSWIYKMN